MCLKQVLLPESLHPFLLHLMSLPEWHYDQVSTALILLMMTSWVSGSVIPILNSVIFMLFSSSYGPHGSLPTVGAAAYNFSLEAGRAHLLPS